MKQRFAPLTNTVPSYTMWGKERKEANLIENGPRRGNAEGLIRRGNAELSG